MLFRYLFVVDKLLMRTKQQQEEEEVGNRLLTPSLDIHYQHQFYATHCQGIAVNHVEITTITIIVIYIIYSITMATRMKSMLGMPYIVVVVIKWSEYTVAMSRRNQNALV